MENQPLISVVIPVYNVEKYLRQCLDSVVNQTYSNLEIILVNDGSKDGSLNICKRYAEKDSRIIILDQANQGLSGARNSGIDIAKGKYISFLDSDDWIELNAFEKAGSVAEAKELDLVFWQFVKEFDNKSVQYQGLFNEYTYFDSENLKQLHRRIAGPLGQEMKNPQLIDSFVSAWGKLFLLSKIRDNKLQFVDTKIIGSEDIFFSFQYFGKIESAYYLHEYLLHYRKDNPTSLTKSHGSTLFPRYCNLFQYLTREIESNNYDEEFKMGLNNRIGISMMNIGLSETSKKNSASTKSKIKLLTSYLNNPIYINAYKTFDFYSLRPHWYIYFYMCKLKSGFGTYMMLKLMRLFVNK